jgi:hypothetical protein
MSDDVGILVCCGSRRGETRHASVVVFTFDFSPRGACYSSLPRMAHHHFLFLYFYVVAYGALILHVMSTHIAAIRN